MFIINLKIKKFLELNKINNADNWLLAKKPIGGNSCASCEAYIGDLHENKEYVPWNKYPMRDPNERLYRVIRNIIKLKKIGSGFSKMLQMLNVDIVNNVNFPPQQQNFNQQRFKIIFSCLLLGIKQQLDLGQVLISKIIRRKEK